MANTRLGNATYVTFGYGQVEPNHLAARRTGQIYAQLPAAASIKLLENGQFAKYDYENGEVNFSGEGEWMLVFNEVKVYAPRETDADFAMIKDNYVAAIYNALGEPMKEGTTMVPRLLRTYPGDIMTTNCIKEEAGSLSVGDKLYVGTDGYLAKTGDQSGPVWVVVKVYTMPDNQPGVKLQRIA